MAGYSGTPLVKKLGIKDGFTVRFEHAPSHLSDLIGPLPAGVTEASVNCDFIHAFYKDRTLFESELGAFMDAIKRDGMIWISWPKKASKVPTDMTEDVVREVALPLGLVDVKVCAVDEVWSGLKLVIRKELR
ncbi:DUF3052 family protein [Kordiimonas lacus]|uniref:DUF3052 domain-containing protein n=1 Tax=Kordiimonas lacus TaxID=637679 RepID=A0A1G6T405_9PROT|nr:DUF3052 family protein [Kordiimonas lacus]SDD23693.1 Protein of unknown function [Kordiimonas lacus]